MHPVSQVTMAACSPPCALVNSHPSQALNYQCHLRSDEITNAQSPSLLERKLSPEGNATQTSILLVALLLSIPIDLTNQTTMQRARTSNIFQSYNIGIFYCTKATATSDLRFLRIPYFIMYVSKPHIHKNSLMISVWQPNLVCNVCVELGQIFVLTACDFTLDQCKFRPIHVTNPSILYSRQFSPEMPHIDLCLSQYNAMGKNKSKQH